MEQRSSDMGFSRRRAGVDTPSAYTSPLNAVIRRVFPPCQRFALGRNLLVVCSCLVLAFVSHARAANPDVVSEPRKVTLVHAGTLLRAPGTPPETRQTLLIEGSRIKFVRDGVLAPDELGLARVNPVVIDLLDHFVLPGLIDAHVHLTLSTGREKSPFELTGEEMLIDGVVNARRTLMAGFTTVRDLGARPYGWPVIVLRDAIDEGRIEGPRILAAGSAISATGGHADVLNRPDEVASRLPTPGVCNGVAACRQAVRRQFGQGADVIKINATGGGGERNGGKDDPPAFFGDELRALVETAHSLNLKVAAHAHGTAGINAALKAGVDSVEHGSFLDEASITLFRQQGTFLVPTLSVHGRIAKEVENASGSAKARMQDFIEHHPANVGHAYGAGARIALGTDAGVVPHGQNARELEWLVGAGMTNTDALRAATLHAAELLGLDAEIGSLEPGKRADLIAVQGNPLKDVSVLRNVAFVMKSGRIYRPAPLRSPKAD